MEHDRNELSIRRTASKGDDNDGGGGKGFFGVCSLSRLASGLRWWTPSVDDGQRRASGDDGATDGGCDGDVVDAVTSQPVTTVADGAATLISIASDDSCTVKDGNYSTREDVQQGRWTALRRVMINKRKTTGCASASTDVVPIAPDVSPPRITALASRY